jgi:hypothetical protein
MLQTMPAAMSPASRRAFNLDFADFQLGATKHSPATPMKVTRSSVLFPGRARIVLLPAALNQYKTANPRAHSEKTYSIRTK